MEKPDSPESGVGAGSSNFSSSRHGDTSIPVTPEPATRVVERGPPFVILCESIYSSTSPSSVDTSETSPTVMLPRPSTRDVGETPKSSREERKEDTAGSSTVEETPKKSREEKREEVTEEVVVEKHKESKCSQTSQKTSVTAPSVAVSVPTQQDRGLAHFQNAVCNRFRVIVSQNRRRYREDGFDLDLTYITDRIIAMGYPADTTEAVYRNSMTHIVRFLEKKHPGHYKVFNLRGQYVYDTSKFHNRVLSFEMTDHHPPRLELMAPFCREVHDYLEADPRNIVAVHCKAGKGRTGVMICAYLTYISFYLTPRQNMDYYSIVRTRNNKGVTIPSQRRYVYYFNHLREHQLNYLPLRIQLVGVYIERPPRISNMLQKGCLSLRVANGDVDVYVGEDMPYSSDDWENEQDEWIGGACSRGDDSFDPSKQGHGGDVISRRAYGWTVPSNRPVFLDGDVRVDVFGKQKVKLLGLGGDKTKIGHIWFNTMFTCPGFCGGEYMHGDEAHPYPPGETTIAHRKREPHRPKSGSASVPNSPPATPKTKGRSSGSVSGRAATRAPSFDARKASKTMSGASGSSSSPAVTFQQQQQSSGSGGRMANAMRRLKSFIVADSSTSRNSEPNIERGTDQRQSGGRKKKGNKEGVAEYELLEPPGLDSHCSKESVDAIYGTETPPRYGIKEMLREAHTKNLIWDSYNERRLSVPQEGQAVKMAPEGCPTANGPFCIRKREGDHVQVYGAIEVDRAFKNKDVDPGFKLIIVTRCVPPRDTSDPIEREQVRKADNFVAETNQRQEAKDKIKKEKIETRQRKIQAATSGNCSAEPPVDANTETCRDDAQWQADARIKDDYLKRFFYRQRSDSISQYPQYQYRCPLLAHCGTCPTSPVTDAPPVTPGSPYGPSGNAFPFRAVREENEADMDVRSYHPEDTQWPNSGSSASSEEEEAPTVVETTPMPPKSPKEERGKST